jgi:hypothetical protein
MVMYQGFFKTKQQQQQKKVFFKTYSSMVYHTIVQYSFFGWLMLSASIRLKVFTFAASTVIDSNI